MSILRLFTRLTGRSRKVNKIPDQSLEEIIATYYSGDFSGVHPAAELFPPPSAEEFDALCNSIKSYGLEDAILRQRSTKLLVDGRSRLLACFVVQQEIRIAETTLDSEDAIMELSIVKNLKRRQLDAGQRAFVALKVRDYYAAEAKKRQAAAGASNIEAYNKGVAPVVVNLPQLASGHDEAEAEARAKAKSKEENRNKARERAAKTVGISGAYVDRAAKIQQFAPELAELVKAGKTSLNEAYNQTKPIIEQQKRAETATAAPAETINIVDVSGNTYPVPKPSGKIKFNQTNDSVGWAKWTWNPVTGCEHGCAFCYAREIAHSKRMESSYPAKFTPVFHQHRLNAPSDTTFPNSDNNAENRVFVCSMADLFGKWVPDDWIRQVFNACMAAPDWTYVFLTKWPKRYQMIASLPHAMFGASIIRQADVKRVERDMAAFSTTGVKWISLEPMLEPITFTDLSWCDLVVIGSQTSTTQPDVGRVPAFAPQFDWVVDVVNQCREAGVPYYLKTNLESNPGMVLPQELPDFSHAE